MFPTIALVLVCFQVFVACEEYSVPANIDLDAILQNDRLLRNYLDCTLGKGKCTPEGEQLKKAIPEALQNECAKCNETHKTGVRKVLHHLVENKPEWWKEVQEAFDPKGEYKVKYEKFLKEEGVAV